MGQHLEGHVLKGTGRPVPQLQTVGIPVHRADGGHRRGIELVRSVGSPGKVGELLDGEFLQKHLHNIHRSLLIGHAQHILQRLARQFGDVAWSQQSAVLCQSLRNGLSGGILDGVVPCADIPHVDPSLSF